VGADGSVVEPPSRRVARPATIPSTKLSLDNPRCMLQSDATMHRLSLRIPDDTLAALRRELDHEREYRGRRYSLNDLCVRKLGSNGTAARVQAGSTTMTGELVIARVPPPPPVPIDPRWQRAWTPPGPREEPQPERTVQASEASAEPMPVLEDAIVEDTPVEYVPDEHAEELTDIAIARLEDEGGPDGNLDH
jgi:hypothetical protein